MLRRCNNCQFAFPSDSFGGQFFIILDSGEQVILKDASITDDAKELTGIPLRELEILGRVGYLSDCVCLECTHQFSVDLDRNVKQCPQCESLRVMSARGAVGQLCPSCGNGKILQSDT